MKCIWLVFAGTLHVLALSNPPLIGYVTYLPGVSADYVAVDRAGYAYFAGTDYRYTPKPPSCTPAPAPSSSPYGYITKLQPRGEGAEWTVCLPGPAGGLALDNAGSVYVVSNPNGSATVSKLNPNNAQTIYATSIPAAVARSIAVDPAGNTYVTGAGKIGFSTTPGHIRAFVRIMTRHALSS